MGAGGIIGKRRGRRRHYTHGLSSHSAWGGNSGKIIERRPGMKSIESSEHDYYIPRILSIDTETEGRIEVQMFIIYYMYFLPIDVCVCVCVCAALFPTHI